MTDVAGPTNTTTELYNVVFLQEQWTFPTHPYTPCGIFLCFSAYVLYRRESNLAISSYPVTKIMYRFYWCTAVNEKKRNF
jgi:hypothetical protein